MSHQRGYGRVLDGEQRARIHTLIIVGRGLAAPKLASGAEHSSVSLDELLRVSEPICTLETPTTPPESAPANRRPHRHPCKFRFPGVASPGKPGPSHDNGGILVVF